MDGTVSAAGAALAGPAGQIEVDQGSAQERGWARGLAIFCALVMLAAVAEIVLDGSLGHSPLIPGSPKLAGWLEGIGERLGFRVFLIALVSFTGAYAGLVAIAHRFTIGRLSSRASIALVGALQLMIFVGPILLSTDVFSYIAYARMGVEHGVNPYLHGPLAIKHDRVYKYVGSDWRHTATAYGPLYTLFSYPVALLGLLGAIWAMKLEALLASIATLALVWRCARARGRDPVLCAADRRSQPAVSDLRPGRRPQRPHHDAADDGRRGFDAHGERCGRARLRGA